MIHHQISAGIHLVLVIPFLVFACEKEELAYPKQPKFAQLPSEMLQQDFALSNMATGTQATQNKDDFAQDFAKDFARDLAKENWHNLFFLKQFSAYFSSFLVQKELDQNHTTETSETSETSETLRLYTHSKSVKVQSLKGCKVAKSQSVLGYLLQ